MKVEDRLLKMFERGGISLSVETLGDTKVLITLSRTRGTQEDAVGGTYDSIDEGLVDCLDKLDMMIRKSIIRKVK